MANLQLAPTLGPVAIAAYVCENASSSHGAASEQRHERLTVACDSRHIRSAGALALFFSALAEAAEPETLENVLAVWRKREAATNSLRVMIDEEHTHGAGVDLDGTPIDARPARLKKRLVLDGTKFRYDIEGESWLHSADGPNHLVHYEAADGDRYKMLWRLTRDDRVLKSFGNIRAVEKHHYLPSIYLRPLLWHYRPLFPPFEMFQLDELNLLSTDEKIAGTRCIVLSEPWGMGGTRKYWVAPEKEMAVIRIVGTFRGSLSHQVDVQFKHDAKKGWIPASWKGASYSNGGTRTLQSGTDVVTEIEINPEVLPSTFDFEYPRRTEVMDHITGKKHIAK